MVSSPERWLIAKGIVEKWPVFDWNNDATRLFWKFIGDSVNCRPTGCLILNVLGENVGN